MTPNEIKIMVGGGQCHIVNEQGKYLAYDEKGKIAFIDDKSKAFVYNYVSNNVPGQLEQVRQAFGAQWRAEAV